MLIETIHSFLAFLRNQGQSRYFNPEEIDAAINRASIDLFNEYRSHFEQDATIANSMRPFKASKISSVTDGKVEIPDNYVQATNAEAGITLDGDTFYYPAEEITDGEWSKRKRNPIIGPEPEYPIFRLTDKIEVLPEDIDKFKLYYLKKPTSAKYAYTDDGRNYIFDKDNSVDLEWQESDHNKIITMTLAYLGIPLKDGILMQISQLKQQE